LKVVFSFKASDTSTGSYITSQYNGDATTNYSYTMQYQAITDYGTSVIAARGSNETYHAWARFATNSTASWGANTFTTFEVDYINYKSTLPKQIMSTVAAPSTGTNYSTTHYAMLYRGNAPITSIFFSAPATYVNGGTATLYGISR
jgi:hypothetical protein